MSNRVIADVGETLIALLRAGMTDMNDPLNELINVDENEIALLPPDAQKRHNQLRLTLFLYAIVENPYLKNDERIVRDSGTIEFAPLSLDLYFLMTAHLREGDNVPGEMDSVLEAYRILGRAMQIFYDNGFLHGTLLQGSLQDLPVELHLTLNPITVEDLTRIWSVFPDLPYRTSVSYIVTPARIESGKTETSQRVVDKEMDHGELVPDREST